jgi:cell wall-associated NlpC family hydrolase
LTPPHHRRLGVLVGIALFLPLLGAAHAAGSPIQDKQAQAARIQQQLDAQGERISQLDERFNEAQLKVQSTQASLTKAQADLAAANARFGQIRSRLSQAAVNAYMHGGNTSTIEQLVKSNGKDLPVRQQYVQAAAADQQSALDDLKAARQDLDALRTKLAANAKDARSAADKLSSDRAAIEAAVNAQQATLSQVKGDLAQLIAQKQASDAAAAAKRATAELAARQAAAAVPRASRSAPGLSSPSGPPPPVGHGAAAAVSTAEAQIGKPYVYGAAGPDSFDCSGLTMYAWRAGGVSLPHSSQSQYSGSTHIPISQIQPGDLLFYYSDIHHVAMYVGGGMMVEAPHTGADVREVPMRFDSLVGAGRVG